MISLVQCNVMYEKHHFFWPTLYMARWKARGGGLLVLIELFRQLSRLRRYVRIFVEIVVFDRGVGHFDCKFQGEGGSSTNDSWRQKTRVPWAITWCCLRDPTFSRFDTIPACDRQTDILHDDG